MHCAFWSCHHQQRAPTTQLTMLSSSISGCCCISRLFLLLGFCLVLNLSQLQQTANCLPATAPLGDGLSLGLGLAQPDSSLQQTPNTPAIERILADNYDGEFAQTERVLGSMITIMETFATGEQLNQADLAQGQAINRWLASHGTNLGQSPILAGQVNELDFVYSTLRPQVWQLIQRIITERPAQASSLNDLAFRCEMRAPEIQSLSELGSKSSIYRVLLDVFNTELYTHCLRRKLATLRLSQVEPPKAVRQLVDVYLGLPLEVVRTGGANLRLTDAARANFVNKMYADYGQAFNLQSAMGRYGSLDQAVQLVLTSDMMSFGGVDESHARTLVAQFKEQCSGYTGELMQYWGNFDQVAVALSSETNNLADFNNRLKWALPHLIYASVCNQLAGVSN